MLSGKGSAYNRRKDNPWTPRGEKKRTWFSEAFDPEHRAEVARERKRERLDCLRRKYHDIPLHYAVIQLFWREGGLTVADLAEILETDEDTINSEIDRAELNAR